MAVTSIPRSSQGSMGQVSGFNQLTPEAMAALLNEVEQDKVDDADGGEVDREPGECRRGMRAYHGVTTRPGLEQNGRQPGRGANELDQPRTGEPGENARIAALRKAKAEVPHAIALEEAGGDAEHQADRGQQAEQEAAIKRAAHQPEAGRHQHHERKDDQAEAGAGWPYALRPPRLVVVEGPQVKEREPPGGEEERVRGKPEPHARREDAALEEGVGRRHRIAGPGSNRHRPLRPGRRNRPPASRWGYRSPRARRRSAERARSSEPAPALAPAIRASGHA